MVVANKRDTVISDSLGEYSRTVDEPVKDIQFSKRRNTGEENAE